MTLAAGKTLGRYQIKSLLGAGGMGEVYRAYDPKIGNIQSGGVTGDRNHFVAAADGQQFLINNLVNEGNTQPITIVLNWANGLKQ